MDFRAYTAGFERWLKTQVPLVRGDLRHKHQTMGDDEFCFLRATYYRWARQFSELDDELSKAPQVLAVGDLHLENFGTWRDSLGRLCWGINDFDEAFPLPLIAIDQDQLFIKPKAACQAIIAGYCEGLDVVGRPFVIGEDHRWFKPILQSPQRDPGLFWDKMRTLPPERGALPAAARGAITSMLPASNLDFRLHHRVAGLGNLGKPRFTAIAEWKGGPIAREAKALTCSSAAWALSNFTGPFYEDIISNAVRSEDPCLKVHGSWVVRRLSPDCRRLELASLSRTKDEEWLLHAMGLETANVHLGTRGARRSIMRHLNHAPKGWLRKSALVMKDKLEHDLSRWNKNG
jgi:hypothetical protein